MGPIKTHPPLTTGNSAWPITRQAAARREEFETKSMWPGPITQQRFVVTAGRSMTLSLQEIHY